MQGCGQGRAVVVSRRSYQSTVRYEKDIWSVASTACDRVQIVIQGDPDKPSDLLPLPTTPRNTMSGTCIDGKDCASLIEMLFTCDE